MTARLDKVIKALEQCRDGKPSCDGCPYDIKSAKCLFLLHSDALELLKEQEAKNVAWSLGRAHCPACGELFPKKKDVQYIRFCSYCGKAVKWE